MILFLTITQRGWSVPKSSNHHSREAFSLLFHCYLPFSFSEFVDTQMRYFGKVFLSKDFTILKNALANFYYKCNIYLLLKRN